MVKYAGFWKRLLAYILDSIIWGAIINLIDLVEKNNLVDFVLANAYLLLLPALWSGYTIGKRLVGIRIVKMNGGKLGIGTLVLREYVGKFVDIIGLFGIISAFMVAFRKDKRSIHDFIAKTYVICEKPSKRSFESDVFLPPN